MQDQKTNSEIKDVCELLRAELDKLYDKDKVPEITDDYHRLFQYFIGEQFEGIEPDKLKICDGSLDKKIDFYEDSEEMFVAYQCKLPEFENIEKKDRPITYGADLVNEAEDILTFLTDDSGRARGNEYVEDARNKYRARNEIAEEDNKSTYKLKVVLAFFGKLTGPAEEELEVLKENWAKNERKCEIAIIDYNNIVSVLEESLLDKVRPPKIVLPNIIKDNLVKTNTWAYALVPAIRFYELFNEYRMSLFDLNVRYYLENSYVNKGIIKTLNEEKGQKRFHLLNNGITISCKNWKFKSTKDPKNKKKILYTITLDHPQIINGCQTVMSLHRAYTQMSKDCTRQTFKNECQIPVRIILTNDEVLLGEVVMASNNQNKMSPRNLVSNSRYQRILQRKFEHLPYKWFYERKDGEFKSLKKHPPKGFKVKDFQSPKKIDRVVSNEDIAKSWLSFIGFSKDASERINAFEYESDRYKMLFEKVPNENHWQAITQGPQVEFTDENFHPKSPSPEQYLLSYIIYQFIKAFLPSPQTNRKECETRLKNSGNINDGDSREVKNSKMMEDEKYVRNQILCNMKEVIVELYSWILVNCYGSIDDNTAKKILNLPGMKDLYSEPDFKTFVIKLNEDKSEKRRNNILFTCFGFIDEAVQRWYNKHEKEYKSDQRRIRFLHSAKTIQQLKLALLDADDQTRLYGYDWKPKDINFLKSLPILPKS